jgi:hypothetical protein
MRSMVEGRTRTSIMQPLPLHDQLREPQFAKREFVVEANTELQTSPVMKNRISFQVEASVVGDTAITPCVDGVRLPDLVKRYERDSMFPDVGGYGGLVLGRFRYGALDRYFLGQAGDANYWNELGGIYLLGCNDCGEVGCWPLVCLVEHRGEDIVWSKFRQPHRPKWDYENFGPFVFSDKGYISALDELQSDLAGMNSK